MLSPCQTLHCPPFTKNLRSEIKPQNRVTSSIFFFGPCVILKISCELMPAYNYKTRREMCFEITVKVNNEIADMFTEKVFR